MLYDVWCIFDEWNGITRADKIWGALTVWRSDVLFNRQGQIRLLQSHFFDSLKVRRIFINVIFWHLQSSNRMVFWWLVSCWSIIINISNHSHHPLTPALRKPWGRIPKDILGEIVSHWPQKPGTKKAAKIRAPNSKFEASYRDPKGEERRPNFLGIFEGLC